MVCSSLPNFSSSTSPTLKSSLAESAIAWRATFCGSGGVVEDAKDGAVGHRAQRPFPIIFILQRTNGAKFHHAKKRAQRDIDAQTGPGTEPNFFPHCRQERGSRNFQAIHAGKKIIGDVVSRGVREDGKVTIRAAQNLHHRAHLRSARSVANVAGDSARLLSSPYGERDAQHNCPSSELTQFQLRPTPLGIAGSYSTANTAEGSTVCFEIL